MTSCPSVEQVSILISSASMLAAEHSRKISTSSIESGTAVSRKTSTVEKKVSFDSPVIAEGFEVEGADAEVLDDSVGDDGDALKDYVQVSKDNEDQSSEVQTEDVAHQQQSV